MIPVGQAILTASLQACALIGCTAALRALLKNRLPKATFLLLWVASLCRLLLPFSIPSPVSLYNLLPGAQASPQIYPVIQHRDIAYEGTSTVIETLPAAVLPQDFAASGPPWLAILWAAVAVLLCALLLAGWLRSRRQLSDALPLLGNPTVEEWLRGVRLLRPLRIYTSDRIASPLTCGILRPRILLPSSMSRGSGETLRYILSHELVHIRRFDCLWKGLFAAACCLHWFNPLVWAMLVLAGRDMELSCDEAVLRRAGHDAREGYAMSLIALAERQARPTVLVHFSRNSVRERVSAVMRFQRPPARTVACAAALALALTAVLATSPWEEDRSISVTMSSAGESIGPDSEYNSSDTTGYSGDSVVNATALAQDFAYSSAQISSDAAGNSHVVYQTEDGSSGEIVLTSADSAASGSRYAAGFGYSVGFIKDGKSYRYITNGPDLLQEGFTVSQLDKVNRIDEKYPDNTISFAMEQIPQKDTTYYFTVGQDAAIGPFSMKNQKGAALDAAQDACDGLVEAGKMDQSDAETAYLNFFYQLMCAGISPVCEETAASNENQ